MWWRHLLVAFGAVFDVAKAFGMQCFLPPESGSVSNPVDGGGGRGFWVPAT